MKITSLTPYKIDPERAENLYKTLTNERLKDSAITPRHKTQEFSVGFMPPSIMGNEDEPEYLETIGHLRRFCVGVEKAVYTPKSVALASNRAVLAFKKKHNLDEINNEQAAQIHHQVKIDIIANAPSELDAWFGWIDTQNHLLIVQASGKTADNITSELRGAAESLPVALVKTEHKPADILTKWLINKGYSETLFINEFGEKAPAFTINNKMKFTGLKDPGQKAAEITLGGEIDSELIDEILNRSFTLKEAEITALGLSTLKIGDKWAFSGYEFLLDDYIEKATTNDPEIDIQLDQQATLLMVADQVNKVLEGLIDACGGLSGLVYPPEPEKDDENQGRLDLNDAETLLASITEAAQSMVNAEKLNALAYGLDNDGTPVLDLDPLTAEMRVFLAQAQKCSISAVQRRLRIGYNRAARLVEFAEAVGWVSIPDEMGRRFVKLDHPDAGKNLDDIKPDPEPSEQ